jgi:hypothetical protein
MYNPVEWSLKEVLDHSVLLQTADMVYDTRPSIVLSETDVGSHELVPGRGAAQ